ncbi:MAG TPA: LysM domain-containing protein [Solirubrobacterales bacterium]|nr:LysM domain-containing protein [Solirubrobacterales bacterium]
MSKRSSAPARVFAAAALIGGFLLVIVVIAGSFGDDEGGGDSPNRPAASNGKQKGGGGNRKPPKSYVVQNGDTLTSIARKTGVPVARIERLNPGVDPQILVSGEKLKLR